MTWRAQDVADAILGRGKPPRGPFPDEVILDLLDDVPLDTEADAAYVVWQSQVPIVWPMVLHRHGQKCNRA